MARKFVTIVKAYSGSEDSNLFKSWSTEKELGHDEWKGVKFVHRDL